MIHIHKTHAAMRYKYLSARQCNNCRFIDNTSSPLKIFSNGSNHNMSECYAHIHLPANLPKFLPENLPCKLRMKLPKKRDAAQKKSKMDLYYKN